MPTGFGVAAGSHKAERIGLWGHGAVDFAGSGVVHAMGGVIALAGALCVGPRLGKFVKGRAVPIPGHHVPMVVFGTFILAFGWFGFNAGSTLSGVDLRISAIVVNTMLASVAGALTSMLTLWAKKMKPDPTMMCNGMLAGLVAVTAPCAFIDSWAARADRSHRRCVGRLECVLLGTLWASMIRWEPSRFTASTASGE